MFLYEEVSCGFRKHDLSFVGGQVERILLFVNVKGFSYFESPNIKMDMISELLIWRYLMSELAMAGKTFLLVGLTKNDESITKDSS